MRFVTEDSARRIALDCAKALVRLVKPDGQFVYRYTDGHKPQPSDVYSSTRHIGAVWFILETNLLLGPSDEFIAAAVLACQPMREQYLVPFAGDNMLAALDEGYVRLGGSSLAINALCRMWDATQQPEYLDDAKRLGEFVLEQQQSTGDFIQARQHPISTVHPMRDPFSAGQAILGLLILYERTGDSRLLEAALRGMKFLDTANYGVQTLSHWMLYALEKLYQHAPNPQLLLYAERIASRILADTSYRKAGLSTPIACRTEGLLAYDRLLGRAGRTSSDSVRTEVMRQVRQNLSLVLKFRTKDGAFVEGDKKPEVRIDFIFHPGRACLAYALRSGHGN